MTCMFPIMITDWFQGYGQKKQHPMYRTSAAEYGAKAPTVHTMPTQFHAKSQQFSLVSLYWGTCIINSERFIQSVMIIQAKSMKFI